MRGIKVSKDETDGLIERTSFMSDEIESKPCTKTKKVIDRGKRSKALSESIESIESSQVCLTQSKNVRSLIQQKICNQQNLNEGLKYM